MWDTTALNVAHSVRGISDTSEERMKQIRGLAAVLAVAALAGGGAVAAASSSSGGTGTTTTGTTTTPTQMPRQHGGPNGFGLGGFELFDTATKTALTETFAAVDTARKSATDAGKSPDEIRDAAIAAAQARLGQAVSDGALTKAQAAAILAALSKQAGAMAAAIDAAAAVLKLTPADLAKRLAAGDRLDEIAKAQGVNVQDVFSAITKLGQGGSGMFGPGFGGGGLGAIGHGGFGHRGFQGEGPGRERGKGPQAPTQTQPSTQSGSYSTSAPRTHI
jgi:hypothetical protein